MITLKMTIPTSGDRHFYGLYSTHELATVHQTLRRDQRPIRADGGGDALGVCRHFGLEHLLEGTRQFFGSGGAGGISQPDA
jgi:hypothetical protein